MRFNLAGPSSNPSNCRPLVKEGLADVSEQYGARANDWSRRDLSLARTRADDKALKDLIKLFLSMLSDEIAIWESFGTTQPSMVVTLDDVPIAIVYERPR